jgi:microsomal epoxide hydrolase
MDSLRPFRIEFTERAVDDLKRRIGNTRWPELAYDTGWTTGTNDAVLRDLAQYWARDYDWFAWQERLNERSHIRGPVEGEEIHAMVKLGPSGQVPLLVIHGWPGSFVEHLESSDRLAAEGFDVVVPSIPGFTFSEAPREPGMAPAKVAERFHLLMRELGYDRYGVQGGDWGAIIGSALARAHPEAVLGLHVNFAMGPGPSEGTPSEEERAWLEHRARFDAEQTGYSRIQGTRPQTLGYAQTDSPVGLLAWILEKFWAWTDHGDDLWASLDRDLVLTNITLYWLTGSITSAARIYYEATHNRGGFGAGPVTVPTGYAKFPKEDWAAPRSMVERAYNVVHYTEMPTGGHFAAVEQPEAFSADVAAFFKGLAAS